MPSYMVFRFDVSDLSQDQRDLLARHAAALRSDIAIVELCPYCHARRENGECSGEDEGPCVEWLCIDAFDPSGGNDPEEHVIDFCVNEGVENAPVPYRNDDLTYYQQLAYLVRERHGLPHPQKIARRLP